MNLEKGNIFTILLGLIAVIGLIAVSAYNTISGPLRSQVNTQLLNEAQTQAIINLRTAAFEAPYVDDDCDSDGHVEPRAFTTTTGNAPTGGGIFASTSGAKQNDPWGNPYGLCVWDIGSASDDAGCGGPSANRLDGTDDHTAGDKVTQTVLAVISAGPDRTFSTTCSAHVDDTTDVITTSGDDIVQRFSYLEAASIGNWAVPSGGSTGKIVFVTSGTWDGNLGGVSGADTKCQSEATSAGLAGTFKAWISDASTSPSTTFIQSSIPYVLTDDTVIANDWADLVDNTIDAKISKDATGASVAASFIWTATQRTGAGYSASNANCSSWTTNTSDWMVAEGYIGYSDETSSGWTDFTPGTCSNFFRLYCFEQ